MLSADRRNLVQTLISLAMLALALAAAALLLVALAPAAARAQAVKPAALSKAEDNPVYAEYKGVRLWMAADEVRAKLGEPASKGDDSDCYTFSESEMAQVFYDAAHKVRAVVVSYLGGAPRPEAVLGRAVEARPDGSQHMMIRYERAGYWVAYTRTAGESPIVTVTMQATR